MYTVCTTACGLVLSMLRILSGVFFLPNEINKEEQRQREYFKSHGSPLLSDYVDHELRKKQRLVELNEIKLGKLFIGLTCIDESSCYNPRRPTSNSGSSKRSEFSLEGLGG